MNKDQKPVYDCTLCRDIGADAECSKCPKKGDDKNDEKRDKD